MLLAISLLFFLFEILLNACIQCSISLCENLPIHTPVSSPTNPIRSSIFYVFVVLFPCPLPPSYSVVSLRCASLGAIFNKERQRGKQRAKVAFRGVSIRRGNRYRGTGGLFFRHFSIFHSPPLPLFYPETQIISVFYLFLRA